MPPPQRLLVVKGYSAGIGSLVTHLLTSMLLAELTNRTPIAHWGTFCLYGSPNRDDAFSEFFEPLSALSIKDCAVPGATYYPPVWSQENVDTDQPLFANDLARQITDLDNPACQSADVVVSAAYFPIEDLMPRIPEDHPWAGLSEPELWRALALRLKPIAPIRDQAEAFIAQHIRGKSSLGIHVRRGDKFTFNSEDVIMPMTSDYLQKIRELEATTRFESIFIATDSHQAIQEFTQVFGDRLHYTECERSQGNQGVHLTSTDRIRSGRELLVDALILGSCDQFIGCNSNIFKLAAFFFRPPNEQLTHYITCDPINAKKIRRQHRLKSIFLLNRNNLIAQKMIGCLKQLKNARQSRS